MKKISRIVLLAALIIILCLPLVDVGASLLSRPLLGSSTTCNDYGGDDACRQKGVLNVDYRWSASVYSYMNPSVAIGTIGYSYWTVREKCDGTITHQINYGGAVVYNSSSMWDSSAQTKHTCYSNRTGESLGNHDFHRSGQSHIYPYKIYTGGL